jgi:hypothetical protein
VKGGVKVNAPDLGDVTWRKGTRSGANGNCVEAARVVDGWHALRDSTNPRGPVLLFPVTEWEVFIEGVKDGDFDRG